MQRWPSGGVVLGGYFASSRHGGEGRISEKNTTLWSALIKQHKIVFGKRRSFGYAVSPFDRSPSKDAGSIPTRS